MSNQETPRKHRSVYKSGQLADLRFELPALRQIAASQQAPVPRLAAAAGWEWNTLGRRDDRGESPVATALERRAVSLLAEAEETAEARLREAEEQVEAMLARTAEAVGQMEQEGRAAGFQAGLEAGQAEAEQLVIEARQEVSRLRAEAEQALTGARSEALKLREALIEQSRAQVLDFAFLIARQVVKAELQLKPEAMLPMLEMALAKLRGELEPHVRVSPDLVAVIEAHGARLVAGLLGTRSLRVEPDESLEPGDFILQTDQGTVDGRVDRQVRVLAEEALVGVQQP